MYIIKSGELRLLQNKKELTLGVGDMYIFNPGELQQPSDSVNCEFYYLHFDTNGVRAFDMADEEYSDAIWKRKADFLNVRNYYTIFANTHQSVKTHKKQLRIWIK